MARIFVDELLLPRFRQRKAQLVATDALRLHFEASCSFQIGGGDPELVRVFTGCADVGRDVVIDNGGVNYFGIRNPGARVKSGERKKQEQNGANIGFHAVSTYGG